MSKGVHNDLVSSGVSNFLNQKFIRNPKLVLLVDMWKQLQVTILIQRSTVMSSLVNPMHPFCLAVRHSLEYAEYYDYNGMKVLEEMAISYNKCAINHSDA
jgi:hypothetical protein